MAQTVVAEQPGHRNVAERRVVTVVFADIVASSAFVSGRDPEEADNSLQSILAVMTASVERYRGTVAQVLGDGIMAIFGAPSAMEDHALRACLAAQDMVTGAAGPREATALGDAALRIGIASGEVVIQTVENASRNDQRAVGECVHVAAKLQQRADPSSVLLSRETCDLVPVGLTVRRAGSLSLAPGSRPTDVFRLVEAGAGRRTALNLLAGNAGPFIGRAAEMAGLMSAWSRTRGGHGQFAFLHGEAGMGKSRLAGEFIRRCENDGCAVVEWPQAPLRRLGQPEDLEAAAQSLLPLLRDTPTAERPRHLAHAAGTAAGPMARCAVARLLGSPEEEPRWSGLDPDQKLAFAVEGLAGAVAGLAGRTPIVLLVEDVHWASAVMVRVLDSLLPLLAGTRLLVLATSRPDPSPAGWRPAGDGVIIPVDPLPASHVEDYLTHWLGTDPSLTPLKERLTAQSQGMPLYLEESLRALDGAGAIVGVPGRYRMVDAARAVPLPPSIHGLIASRIDTLGDHSRRTLLLAAVIGMTVDAGLLRQLGPVAPSLLPRVLDDLESQGFLERTRVLPNLEYRFRHALFQDVAYVTLTKRERRALHERIFLGLRKRREADLPGRLELMAHHSFRAELWKPAHVCGRAAGRKADAMSQFDKAAALYEQSLAALDHLGDGQRNTERRIDLNIAIARMGLPRGVQDVGERLETARALATARGDWNRLARAVSLQCSFAWAWGDLGRAQELAEQGIDLARRTGDRANLATTYSRLGSMLTDFGRFDEAVPALSACLDATSQDPLPLSGSAANPRVVALCHLARIAAERDEHDDALRFSNAAVRLSEDCKHAFTETLAMTQVGRAHSLLGNHREALAFFEHAHALAETTRIRLWLPMICAGLAASLSMCGRTGESAHLLASNRKLIHRTDGPSVFVSHTLLFASHAHFQNGDVRGGIECATTALATADALDQRDVSLRCRLHLLEMRAAGGKPPAGWFDALRDLAALAEQGRFRGTAARCRRLMSARTDVAA